NPAETVGLLQGLQDQETGLFPEEHSRMHGKALRYEPKALYNVLAVGYALGLLGTGPRQHVHAVELGAGELDEWLSALPWSTRA
ncbi:acyltransferase, partial [Rhizobium ruizarguesonis]